MEIVLPADAAQIVKDKVASGEYRSETEVIVEGLRVLQAQDSAVETWLQIDVAAAYDEYKADPSRAIPADQVFERIKARKRLHDPAADDV